MLSSPRVSTMHNQKAVIKAGSDEFFVTGVSSNTTTGTATTTTVDVELTPFFSGVALDVTPQISDDGDVLMHIHPTVSDVTDQQKELSVRGQTDSLPLALSQIRESDSIVRAHSGQVIVIGGLMRQTRHEQDYKTPLLGDIPGLGKLFRSERKQNSTVELVILLRPLVVDDNAWPQIVKDETDRVDRAGAQGQAAVSENRRKKVRLGELLLEQKLITPEQLQSALAEQKRSGRKLGRVLTDMGLVREEKLHELLARQSADSVHRRAPADARSADGAFAA